jgi:hypothetical protein
MAATGEAPPVLFFPPEEANTQDAMTAFIADELLELRCA